MSFVNEVGFNELVNDLRIDENLVVEGSASIENLTVKNLTVLGTTSGVAASTFTIGAGDEEEEITLEEKVELIDDEISALQTLSANNASAISLRALKTTVNTKAENTDTELFFSALPKKKNQCSASPGSGLIPD